MMARIGFYRWMTRFASPLVDLYLHRRLKAGKEDAERFGERLGTPSRPRPDGSLVWIHGASVGESLSALPLVRAIRKSWPETNILVTTGTVTSAKLMLERLPDRAFHQYAPIDRLSGVKSFLDYWRPDIALWMESEFWPNLLLETASRETPMLLINGRVSDRSFTRWRKNLPMIQALLRSFALTLGQTEEDADRLRALGAPDVDCLGNLKAAADPLPCGTDELEAMRQRLAGRPRWLAASTHPGEEIFCLDVHESLREKHPGILTIIVPRHPRRGPSIRRTLSGETDVAVGLRSAGDAPTPETGIYIADTIGELGLFYRLCPMAFIGKSLGADGGQNPLEAARVGSAILFGPNMTNFREMANRILARGAAIQIHSAADLSDNLSRLLSAPEDIEKLRNAALAHANEEARALDRILDGLMPHLRGRLGDPS